MDIKLLLSILNRPWFIEPGQAHAYAEMAANLLRTGNMPVTDKRRFYGDRVSDDYYALFRVDSSGAVNPEGQVQVIRLNYPVAKYDFCGDPGSQTIQQFIHSANADSSIASIILWVDSPGGQVDGTDALAGAVKASKKPIVAYSDGMICSAAYWISSSAREIIVHGNGEAYHASIGSIGTMARWVDMSGKYEKDGIKVHTVFASASKDKWGTFLAANAGNYEGLRQELDTINEKFLAAVKVNRAGKINLDKENVLTGKVYDADKALAHGLIDKIGSFQYAVQRSLELASGSSSNTTSTPVIMKFPNTMTAAKADKDFEVLNEGIWLTAEQLGNVEETLTQNSAALTAAQAQATAASETITTMTATIETLTAKATADQKAIADLQAEVARLGKLDAGNFSAAASEKDDKFDTAEEDSFETSYDRELKSILG